MSCSRSPKILFAVQEGSELSIYSSPQPQNPGENSPNIVPNYHMKFSFSGYFEESGHVNGLIFLKDVSMLKGKAKMVFKIYNPSTGQTLVLPKVKTCRNNVWWSLFGYDPIGKQLKVLAMSTKDGMCDEFQVLTLGSGNMSWKRIECCIPHNRPWKHICINGVLYYISSDCPLIVCFNVRSEKFTFIKTMETFNGSVLKKRVELINYNGKLGLIQCEVDVSIFFFTNRSKWFKLWVLEDLEKQEWSHHTFVFPSVRKYMVGHVKFAGVTQTNEIVLSSFHSAFPLFLFYLNLEKETIERVLIQGLETTKKMGIYHTFLHNDENVKLYANV